MSKSQKASTAMISKVKDSIGLSYILSNILSFVMKNESAQVDTKYDIVAIMHHHNARLSISLMHIAFKLDLDEHNNNVLYVGFGKGVNDSIIKYDAIKLESINETRYWIETNISNHLAEVMKVSKDAKHAPRLIDVYMKLHTVRNKDLLVDIDTEFEIEFNNNFPYYDQIVEMREDMNLVKLEGRKARSRVIRSIGNTYNLQNFIEIIKTDFHTTEKTCFSVFIDLSVKRAMKCSAKQKVITKYNYE